jgi:hypothetical protein
MLVGSDGSPSRVVALEGMDLPSEFSVRLAYPADGRYAKTEVPLRSVRIE